MAASNGALLRVVAGLAATTITVAATMAASVDDFNYYTVPEKLKIQWYDYRNGSTWTQNPKDDPTIYSTHFKHRAVFFGGYRSSSASQSDYYKAYVYIIYSSEPVTELFTFRYLPSRSTHGSIRCTAKNTYSLGQSADKKALVVWTNPNIDIKSATTDYTLKSYVFSSWSKPGSTYYFDFDFYFSCEGSLQVDGVWNIPDVPYQYILKCKDTGGHSGPGASEPPGGGSPGGGSSSGGNSSESSGGGGSPPGGDEPPEGGGSSSGEPSEEPPLEENSSYPWESGDGPGNDFNPGVPEYANNGEDGEGENGSTWKLPEWETPSKPFSPDTLPDYPLPGGLIPKHKEPAFPHNDLEYSRPEFPFPDLEYSQPDVPQLPGGWPPPLPPPQT